MSTPNQRTFVADIRIWRPNLKTQIDFQTTYMNDRKIVQGIIYVNYNGNSMRTRSSNKNNKLTERRMVNVQVVLMVCVLQSAS